MPVYLVAIVDAISCGVQRRVEELFLNDPIFENYALKMLIETLYIVKVWYEELKVTPNSLLSPQVC